jgi:hypothetical protein
MQPNNAMDLPESSQLPRSPIVQSFRAQILERHEAARRADALLREQLLENLEQKRQTGALILQAKGTLRQLEFAAVVDFLSTRTVREYIRFAQTAPIKDNFPAAVHSIQTALRLTDALPTPKGHGPQKSHEPPPFFSWAARAVMQFKLGWSKFLIAKPLDSWTLPEAEQFEFQLRPILKVHRQIIDWIQRQ